MISKLSVVVNRLRRLDTPAAGFGPDVDRRGKRTTCRDGARRDLPARTAPRRDRCRWNAHPGRRSCRFPGEGGRHGRTSDPVNRPSLDRSVTQQPRIPPADGGNGRGGEERRPTVGEPARQLEDRLLYRRYVEALKRYGPPEPKPPSPGHAIRRCPGCGSTTIFRLDPDGTWYECTRCGHFA